MVYLVWGGGGCYRPAVIAAMRFCGDPAKIGQTEGINEKNKK